MPETVKTKPNKKHLKRLFGLLKPYKLNLSIWFVAMVVTTVATLLFPQYIKVVFDEALTTGNLKTLNNLVSISMVLITIIAIGVFVRSYFIKYTSDTIVRHFRSQVFAHVIKLDIGFFESRSTGEIISRLTSDITVIREFLELAMPIMARGTILAIGASIALFITKWDIALLLFVVAPVLIVTIVILGRTWRKYSKEIQDTFALIVANVEETISGIRAVRSFNAAERSANTVDSLLANALKLARLIAISRAGFMAFVILVGFASITFVIWLGGKAVITGDMSLGEMMAFMLYLAFLGDGVGSLSQFWPALQNAAGATERAFDLLAEKPQILEIKNPKTLPQAKNGRAVEFQNINFTYPSRPNEMALSNFSLKIKAGETVAIVGPSGAGKSTIFAILMRFYDAQKGKILLDNINTKNLKFETLRNSMAMVAQDSTIFSTTIAQNIAYGKPNASMEEIKQAAKVAYANGFIESLPETYNTQVGEKGVRLSGGQKQRIAIARTVLRNPDVLLLDEATSSLDAKSEQEVQKSLSKLQKGRTTIVIAHRLATVKSANKIVVLDKGQKIAEGTHKTLIKTCPLYRNLAELQFIN